MVWERLLAYVTGTVNEELLLRNEHLAAENRLQSRCSRADDASRRPALSERRAALKMQRERQTAGLQGLPIKGPRENS